MENRIWKTFGIFAGIVLFILISVNASYAGALTPQKGGILKISNPGEPPIFNPMMNPSMRVIGWTAEVFNGLVMVDPTQEEVSVEKVVPSLAEKWEISADKKVYTFHLRRGVKFHDGKPFTAKDVKYSLDIFADPEKGAFASLVEMMERVEIINDHTVKVHLKYPHAPFLLYLSFPYCVMLPAHLSKVNPKSTDFLIGTGPFKFKNRIPGKVFVYERNPDYFIKGLPYLDGVEFYTMITSTGTDGFIAGRLDMAHNLRNSLDDQHQVDKIKKHVPGALIKLKPTNVLRGVVFNAGGVKDRKGPWQDVRVRRAMAMVTDYPGAIIAGQGGVEMGVSSWIVPPHVPTGLPWAEVEKILGIDKPMDVRIREAKKLMREAGYADGFKAELITRETAIFTKPAEYLTQSWRKDLNIQADIKALPPAVLFPRKDTGDFDLMLDGSPALIGGTPEETLRMFLSNSITNYGHWANSEYDRLYQQLTREPDLKKRAEISGRMQRISLEEVPIVIFASPSVGTAHRPKLHGHVMQTGHTNWACFDRMWMEK